jgi:phosphoglycerate dehydrogenase-like enzyme/shikimate 5-dehydrogenase
MRDLKLCRVLVTPTTFGIYEPSLRTELESTVGEVVYNDLGRPLSSREVQLRLQGVDGYIAGLDTIDRAALESADRLKVIARYGIGVDKVDLDAARERSIVVANTPDANSVSVAELAVGLIISLARSIPQSSFELKNGKWPRNCGFTLQGKTVGLFGFGAIGKEVARRLAGWDCRIVACDVCPDLDTAHALGVELIHTEEVLAQSDFLTLHVPVVAATRQMVNAAFLARMKLRAFLINTARGELIDDVALTAAISSGQIAGAALDVYSQEPPPSDNGLLRLPQVIATPHCGAHTDGATVAMGRGALKACLAVLRGDWPEHPVVAYSNTSAYVIKKQIRPTMYFIGVTTRQSSIMKVFPLWMPELGRSDVVIEGIDLQLHDQPENYRNAIAQIKFDPLSVGALVTSHKIDLLTAGRDMFDYLDPYAVTCGEVSSISKHGPKLEGYAKDPITAGLSLDALLGMGYFGRTNGEVLCLGAGGSTMAIALHFALKKHPSDRPKRMVIVNRSSGRLEHLKGIMARLDTDIECVYHCNARPEMNDEILAQMPQASLIINATGMGKDTPGSPLTNYAQFPKNGIAWDLNYRGELDFLHQALKQVVSRSLTVEDGWLYFLHGWTQVIIQVLGVKIEGEMFDRLAAIAGRICMPALQKRVVPDGHEKDLNPRV